MPEMNGTWKEEALQPGDGIHPGVAISLRGGGLITPALHDADQETLPEMMAGVRDLVAARPSGSPTRLGDVGPDHHRSRSLGERGVEVVHGVIYPPQVALVGFGAVASGRGRSTGCSQSDPSSARR